MKHPRCHGLQPGEAIGTIPHVRRNSTTQTWTVFQPGIAVRRLGRGRKFYTPWIFAWQITPVYEGVPSWIKQLRFGARLGWPWRSYIWGLQTLGSPRASPRGQRCISRGTHRWNRLRSSGPGDESKNVWPIYHEIVVGKTIHLQTYYSNGYCWLVMVVNGYCWLLMAINWWLLYNCYDIMVIDAYSPVYPAVASLSNRSLARSIQFSRTRTSKKCGKSREGSWQWLVTA
jgi:hypothetical protein